MTATPDGTKTCPTCRKSLSLGAYNKNRSTSDGLYYECKVCRGARTNSRFNRRESMSSMQARRKARNNKPDEARP